MRCPGVRFQEGGHRAGSRCPDQPETYNGLKDEDGCPDRLDVTVGPRALRFDGRIRFDAGEASLTRISHGILSDVASAIKALAYFKSLSSSEAGRPPTRP